MSFWLSVSDRFTVRIPPIILEDILGQIFTPEGGAWKNWIGTSQ